ncbi:MAG: hypothetical protein Q8O53_02395 [Candidatus Moranbacteria bacterium]|nr:hypothetical protein [Candidatus Moranbacteria bacterium]
MKTTGKGVGILPALLVALLSFGGFMGAAAIMTNNNLSLVPASLADDGEDDDSDDEEEEDEDEDDNKPSDSAKKAKEAAKKKLEREREATKKAAERSGKESNSDDDANDDGDDEMDDDANDDADELENEDGDDNGMYKDRAKTISKLAEDIADAEKEILEKRAEGVDVTAALARLATAKAGVMSVNGAFDGNDLEAAKRLSKEVKKLAHFAKEDLHDAKKIAEDAAKVSKRITQAKGKIVLLEAVGGDSSKFISSLATYESDLAALKATIMAGNYDLAAMEDSLEVLERKVKSLKSSIEGTIYALGGTDSELDDDLEDESDDIAEHLNDVADVEDDNVGLVIRRLSDDHKDATKKVGETVKSIDKRSPVLQALFGANRDDLNGLEQDIAANKARTAVLLQAANTIEDQDIKSILLEQVETLKGQTSKLEAFVSGQRSRLSAFGWFFNLF